MKLTEAPGGGGHSAGVTSKSIAFIISEVAERFPNSRGDAQKWRFTGSERIGRGGLPRRFLVLQDTDL